MRQAHAMVMRNVDAAMRCASFCLLILALLGYCGLPSNPPADLFQAKWMQLSAGDTSARRIAPTQADEHFGREGYSLDQPATPDAADDGDSPAKAALVSSGIALVEPACDDDALLASGQPHCPRPTSLTRPLSRAPPAA